MYDEQSGSSLIQTVHPISESGSINLKSFGPGAGLDPSSCATPVVHAILKEVVYA